ncbi:hypothetical protein VTK73DRAFT_6361 [Phialemonium thermophilum]|uniref:Uncharacterized protein n=1 Tax=Phialemonium thermophilum TaxID=223376 RepID=A0ABR3WK23_9PEZI
MITLAHPLSLGLRSTSVRARRLWHLHRSIRCATVSYRLYHPNSPLVLSAPPPQSGKQFSRPSGGHSACQAWWLHFNQTKFLLSAGQQRKNQAKSCGAEQHSYLSSLQTRSTTTGFVRLSCQMRLLPLPSPYFLVRQHCTRSAILSPSSCSTVRGRKGLILGFTSILCRRCCGAHLRTCGTPHTLLYIAFPAPPYCTSVMSWR